MGSGGAIPGWGADTGVALPEPDRLRIPELLTEVWTTYRTRRREILRAAIAVQGSLALAFVPFEILRVARIESLWTPLPTFAANGRQDMTTFFKLALGATDPVAAAAAVLAPTAALLAMLLLTGMMAALLLGPREGDRTIGGALRATVRRAPVVAVPVLLLAAFGCVGVIVESAWIGGLDQISPTSPDASEEFQGVFGFIAVFDLLLLAVGVFVVYGIVRWAVAIPASIVEGIGLRASLRRSSELTRGHRLSVALALFALVFATSLVNGWAVDIVAFAMSNAVTLESGTGILLSSIPGLALSVLLAPFVPLVLVVLYRDLELASRRTRT